MKGIRAAAGLGLILLLTACAAAPSSAEPQLNLPTADTRLAVSQTPSLITSSPADQPSTNDPSTSTPDPGKNCHLTGGKVDEYLIPGEEELAGRIYTPPCYDSAREERYPVLYMLHGDTETDLQWDDLGLDEWADALIAESEIPPLIIVMPREMTWVELPENPFGDQLVKTVIPWIDSHYRTYPDRQFRAVGGLSRGGNWAVRLGLLHWGLFGSIGAHSTPLFFGDLNRLEDWVQIIPDSMVPRILIDIGEGDKNLVESEQFHQLLLDLEIPHQWQLKTGLHNDDYWRSQIENYLRWYSSAWNK